MSTPTQAQAQAFAKEEIKRYTYTAVNPEGKRVTDKMQATSQGAVERALIDDGYTPINVKANDGLNIDLNLNFGVASMKVGELAIFARTFHQLIKAGISIQKSLESLALETSPAKAEMLRDLATRVGAGQPLSSAMGAYPKCFDAVFCSYIAAGEQSGTLTESTRRLAADLDKRAELKQRLKQVTAYPKLVFGAITLLVGGIILFLVPQYQKIYEQFHAKLPAPTQFLIDISKIFPLIILAMVGIGFGLFVFYKSLTRKIEYGERIDRVRFRLPIFGKLTHRQTLYRWTTTLAGAMAAGVPYADALTLAAAASGSFWQQALLPRLLETLRSGRRVSEEISQPDLQSLFPSNVRIMLNTGEQTGDLPTMLESVSGAIDDDINTLISGLSAKMEVALLLVLGVVVGGLLVVLYLPILHLATTVGKGLQSTSK